MAAVLASAEQQARRRRVRHSVLLWSAVALGFYVGFIVLILVRATR
jgi:hypothetical protein